jgi:prophage regulatory protein
MPSATRPITRLSARPARAAEILGVSLPTLWRYLKRNPDFPRPRRLSARCTVFDFDELIAWRDSRAVAEVKPAITRKADHAESPAPSGWRARLVGGAA